MVNGDEILQNLDGDLYFNDGKFMPQKLAGNIVFQFFDEMTGKGINRGFQVTKDNKEIYRYNGGYYDPDGEDFIRDIAQITLKERCKEHYLNEVISWVKTNSFFHIDRGDFDQNLNFVNLENGIYDIQKKQLIEHDQSKLFISQLPVKYDPTADCPKIKQFIHEIIYDDDISTLQEFIGFCLYRKYLFHRACMFIGDGKNGKSTLLKLIMTFLGENNVSNKELQDLIYNRFSLAKLYGKHANICGDLSDRALQNPGRFKILTGQDRIDAEEKFKGSFEFVNYAKLLFSTNKLPKSDDESYAFYRRWILISFPNVFEGDKCDPNILDKITTDQELSGLLNWAIEGLQRLLANGEFSYGKTVEDVANQYKTLSDPVYAFCNEFLKCEMNEYILKEDLRQRYYEWCEKNKLPKTPMNTLTGELSKHLPDLRAGNGGPKGNQKAAYRNITWKLMDQDPLTLHTEGLGEFGIGGLEN